MEGGSLGPRVLIDLALVFLLIVSMVLDIFLYASLFVSMAPIEVSVFRFVLNVW